MLRHKNIDRVCCIVLALTLLLSTVFVGAAATGLITEDATIGYETRLFDQSRVHTIDIVMDDWDAFVSTATSEEYASCHLVIDGESYKNVAIRGKGNTSLSSVQSYGNDRYSFKVEFDHYQSGATYHGLDKLSLNNLIQDNTYMKDYFAYTLMNKMGVAAPLCSFVQVNVNGEPWGLYLAVEGVEDAFLQRNYGKDHGELYKPDSLSFGGGRGNGRDFDMDEMAEQFGFSFGGDSGDNSGETQTFTMPESSEMPAAPDGFEASGGSSEDDADSSGSSGSQSSSAATATPEPTPTATPVPTATPAPANDASSGQSSGESSGDPAGGSSGDTAGSSGMPSMPMDGTMPDMSGFQMPGGEVPAMPTDGTMPDMSGFQMPGGEVPAMPTDGTMPDMSGFQMPGGEVPAMPTDGTMPAMPENFDPSQMGGDFQMPEGGFGGGFGGFGSSTDVKLQYSDDDPSSYANIFNNAKTDISAADQTRLIASLKALGEGDTSVVDTEAVIRYMAVHNFLCNDDSYTGMMVHNYYLYEEDGVLAMIPWDYNLAYGTMSGTNATSSVNADIDRLVSMGSDSDRPMASWITSSGEHMAQYHAIYQEFMTTVFDSGWFAEEIDRVTAMIAPYVEADPTAFCTYEEFLTGAETLRQFCLRRARSVSNQLDGSNASVDASDLTLSDMGTMGSMGGPGGDRGGFDRSDRDFSSRSGNGSKPAAPTGGAEAGASVLEMPAATPAASAEPAGSSERQATGRPTTEPTEEPGKAEERSRPSFDAGFDLSGMSRQSNTRSGWLWIAVCAALLCAALAYAGFCRNHR